MQRTKTVLSLVKRIKPRHLKLGPRMLAALFFYHYNASIKKSESKEYGEIVSDWIVNNSTLTIGITVFNQSEEELQRCILSVRSQHGAKITIIIFDGGSFNESTITFLEKFKCRENEILIRSSNEGVIAARNKILELASTDFILFVDPDDTLENQYISEAFKFLEADRSTEIIYPNVLVHDPSIQSFKVWGTGPFSLDILQQHNTLPMSSLVSTRLMKQLGGYSEDFKYGAEDWDLWVRAAMSKAKAVHLSHIGYVYQISPFSRSSKATDNAELIKLRLVGKKPALPLNIQNKVQVFLSIPWLPRIGGVEKYVKCLMDDFKSVGISAALLITEDDPRVYKNDSENYRNIGNLVLKRVDFPNDDYYLMALERLAAPNSISINFGSPWEFLNFGKINSIFSKKVCFIFNTEISLARGIAFERNFDEFWVAYEKIKDEIPEKMQLRSHTVYTGVVSESVRLRTHNIGSTFKVGFLGRYAPEKNPDAFLDLAKAAVNYSDFKFVMAGEGPLDERVKKRSAVLKNVENVGFVFDVKSFFEELDCLVITSETEGIPLSVMEALSFGIPIISRPVGGMQEILENQNNGFIWSGDSREALNYLQILKAKKDKKRNVVELDGKFLRQNTFHLVLRRVNDLLNED